MKFRADWRTPVLWMALAPLYIMGSVHRFHKDGWHSSFAWIQLVCWSGIFILWGMKMSESWHFENDRLVLKRILLPTITIPYESITSIDLTGGKNIALTLGAAPVFRRLNKRYVMVRDTSGFLSEMEHHVAPDVLQI